MLTYLPVAWETAQRNPAPAQRRTTGRNTAWTPARSASSFGGLVLLECDNVLFCLVLRCAFWVWIDASANDAPWMDAVSATVPKRRLVTRSCSSPCCLSVGSYGKVTRRQKIKPPPPSIRRHFIINLGVFKGHQYNKWGYNPTLRPPRRLWRTGAWVLYRCGALSYWVKLSWNCQDARFAIFSLL